MSTQRAPRTSLLLGLATLGCLAGLACHAGDGGSAPDAGASAQPAAAAAPPSMPVSPPSPSSVDPSGDPLLTRRLACMTPDKLDSSMTPPDLYAALNDCARHARYADALVLFALAGVYGRFDTLRVADETAHRETAVLRMEYFDSLPADVQKAFLAEHDREDTDAGAHKNLCDLIARVGPPSYAPRYMLQRGVGGHTQQATDDGIVVGFDAASGWRKAMSTYLHCTVR